MIIVRAFSLFVWNSLAHHYFAHPLRVFSIFLEVLYVAFRTPRCQLITQSQGYKNIFIPFTTKHLPQWLLNFISLYDTNKSSSFINTYQRSIFFKKKKYYQPSPFCLINIHFLLLEYCKLLLPEYCKLASYGSLAEILTCLSNFIISELICTKWQLISH